VAPPSFLEILAQRLVGTFQIWGGVPGGFWRVLWPLLLMSLSAYPLVVCWPVVRRAIPSRLDRWFLAPLMAMAYYTVVFIVLNGALRVPIGEFSFYVVCALTAAAGYGWMLRGGVEWKGQWRRSDWIVVAALAALTWLAGATRFETTVADPDRLLDSDPYRHHPRAEWIVQTGPS